LTIFTGRGGACIQGFAVLILLVARGSACALLTFRRMRYLALASDYDGTLAHEGGVDAPTLRALRYLKESGRRLILVTGRELSDLRAVFPELALFDRIVAENGAQVFTPATGEDFLLGPEPPPELVSRLRARGVAPLSVGRAIVATWEPHQHTVLSVIQELGLELQVIFNKGAVMVLPSGVNKASGLARALSELGLSAHNVVGVGDAENDHALLAHCELGVAVQNALPSLQERADWVTRGARGAGVSELIDALVASDLAPLQAALSRHDLPLAAPAREQNVEARGSARESSSDEAEGAITLHPYGRRVLLCGTSGSGKSTLATSFLERLFDATYQVCLIDPEGDFEALEPAITLGDEREAPRGEEVLRVLSRPESSVVVNLLGLPLEERPGFFVELLARVGELQRSVGHPHWWVVDEAHHMLSANDRLLPEPVLKLPQSLLLITVHPERLAPEVLKQINTVIVVGETPREMLEAFAERTGISPPRLADGPLPQGEALFWRCDQSAPPQRFRPLPPKLERHRHRRKYAAGELGEDKSFYFRGPEQKLNLRASNLQLFLQMADGVDEATWLHHLAQHDYSTWVRSAIKNDALADELASIERETREAGQSKKLVREAIERVYTRPA
jgi:HAD superfamily hydrolase (TIGR01484 family)